MSFLEVGSSEDHCLVNIGQRSDLIAGNLVDLHFVESGDNAFPGGTLHRFDDDYGAGELLIVTDFLGLGLELFLGGREGFCGYP